MQRRLIAPEPEKRGLYDVADGVASTMFFLMIKERESQINRIISELTTLR
jgi:hypothetical protein